MVEASLCTRLVDRLAGLDRKTLHFSGYVGADENEKGN